MALRHKAFLLDAHEFREKVLPILVSLDSGDARPLYELALSTFRRTEPSKWVLGMAGSSLLDITKVNSVGLPANRSVEDLLRDTSAIPPSELGYWLLLIFSDFLQECPGIGVNYAILDRVLNMLGWSQDDRRLLFEGVPTSTLLKPASTPVPTVSEKDPYWYWMIPSHANKRGWLSQDQILRLYHQLHAEGRSIRTFDHRRFGEKWGLMPITVPDGQLDYLKRLHEAFEHAIMMLEASQQAKTELYLVISD